MSNALLRISTSEAVVNYFMQKIQAGELKPGDKLPSERKLQDELGISRFALREGLARLNALGIINSAQGKASVVNSDVDSQSLNNVFLPLCAGEDPKYFDDLFASRILIEAETVSLAAANRTEEDVQVLNELLGQTSKALGIPERFIDLDYRFHYLIAEIGGNIFLAKIHGLLQHQLKATMARSTSTSSHREKSLAWHKKIAVCIGEADGEGAANAMRQHLAACRIAVN